MIRIGSVFIPVTNLVKAIAWYEKHLDVQKIEEWGDGVGKGAGFYFPNSPTQLGLVQVESATSTEFQVKGEHRNSYFNFLVEDIQDFYRKLNDAGVETTELEDFGGMTCFDFYDLNGNPFSVVNEVKNSPFHSDEIKKLQAQADF
ncbi:VOC family protein [Pseudalkalibacillus hwajinpoensis]|uniref:VOC family protein n=1 Tax=Guptibacillus hwajinpoensis TaxID=208199 RepID=UPI001CD31847|nr:VOC family protein [Pseudalkalibacillus hwajinpoensis]MCA0992117.1 VOC family protein [Pseudalkalibacillus hwajinpoensis]